jgi:hypothetical protein
MKLPRAIDLADIRPPPSTQRSCPKKRFLPYGIYDRPSIRTRFALDLANPRPMFAIPANEGGTCVFIQFVRD